MRQASWILGVGVAVTLTGCGMKGPLYLPDKNASVVTRPGTAGAVPDGAPGQAATGSSKPGDSTSTAPSAVPEGTAAAPSPPKRDSKDDDSQGSAPKN